MTHILVTLTAQLFVGILSGRWMLGGIYFSAFYLGREITQAEYRWISAFGQGRRINMPWWGGLDLQVWNWKSVADALGPTIGCLGFICALLVLKHIGKVKIF